MKLKHLFAFMAFISCTLCFFTACSDHDYAPITLVNVNDEGERIDKNTLVINAFNQGTAFYIQGGDGHYTIKNNSADIVDYRYDGKELTFIPVGLGTGTIVIADFAGNSMVLTIEVTNRESTYFVQELNSEVYGDRLFVGDKDELEKKVINDSFVKVGGRYTFTFTDPTQTLGSVTIYPTDSGKPISGVFSMEEKYTEKGVKYEEFSITFADKTEHILMLLKSEKDNQKEFIFQEDVTETYKTNYPELEKAWLIQKVTF